MKILKGTILWLLVLMCVLIAVPSYGRAMEQQQPDAQQRAPVDDPIRELNLSPQQRERIRAIREQLREERTAINQRLRETNLSLEEALDADNPDDALIEQRLRDVAAAQAASMRMRVLSEVRIRRVLTPDQVKTLRMLRQSAKAVRRERQLDNIDTLRRERLNRQRGTQSQRNGLGPFLPRRIQPQRRSRP